MATVGKFKVPRSRLTDMSEAQGAVGGLGKRGKTSLWGSMSAIGNATAAMVTARLPRSKSGGGIISAEPLESLMANLVAGNMGRRSAKPAVAAGSMRTVSGDGADRVEDDYRWETDPNGCWLSSFP